MQNFNQHPLFMPATLGSRVLRGRLVLPPMASGTADEGGRVTSQTLAHYDRMVGDRHALAWVEYTAVHPWGKSEPHQAMLCDEEHLPGLAALAALIRSKGALAGIQLTHAGGKTDAETIGRAPLGPSAVPIPAHGGDLPAPTPMSEAELEEVVQAFVLAARRAEGVGFQAIEVHAAHGYFWNQWLSPITNRRGGDRHAPLVELVARLRRVLRSETVLAMRFPGQDRLPGGLELAETAALARKLKQAGLDLLDVSSGLGGWRRQRDQRGEGYMVADAAALREATGLPVIGVGGVSSLEYAAQALAGVDFLAVGRAMLENPLWPLPAAGAGSVAA